MRNWTECSLAQHILPIRFFQFFVSSMCLLVRVTMVDKNKAVVCFLVTTLAIMLSEKKRKRKMWSKKWYLKRNISCDAHLLNEVLETDVPWDDAIVVSAGKLRKLWNSLSKLRSSVCERRLERAVVRPALLHVKTEQFAQFFRQAWRYTVRKVAQFNWECIGRLRHRSAAPRLLRSWVRIPPGAWMSVLSVMCCQVEVSAKRWSLVQRSPTDWGASLCVI